MKSFIILSLLIALQICSSTAQIPSPPIWPNVFAQDFVETVTGDNNSTIRDVGSYYYNYTSNTHLQSRSNGQYDFFCGFNEEPLACDQIVVDNNRYVYFPEVDECCYCCGYEDGCAILKPRWFINPTFLGTIDYYGVEAYSWVIYEEPNQQGPNYYYETTEAVPQDRKTLYIARNNYAQQFLLESYRTEFPAITLPSKCKATGLTSCPGVCAEVRGDSSAAF